MFKKIITKINEMANTVTVKAMAAMESQEGAVTVEAAILIVVAVVVGIAYLNSSDSLLSSIFTDLGTKVKSIFESGVIS